MTSLFFKQLLFADLSPDQLYEVLHLRQLVFVLEQQCLFMDLDYLDQKAYHLLGYDKLNKLVAYARLLPEDIPYKGFCSIGRVVTHPEVRSTGAGLELMTEAIKQLSLLAPGVPVKIGAQFYLERFYSNFGFEPIGEIYDEDGIDHIHMIKP